MSLFSALLLSSPEARVLDVGGTPDVWRRWGAGPRVTVLNRCLEFEGVRDGIEFVRGDARDLSRYQTGAFDAVLSNSVIEHVGSLADQRAMASEIRRVGRSYFVQVPNYFFPLEPHFLFPGFQFVPRPTRLAIARVWPFGWSRPGSPEALEDACSIRLLSCGELAGLFPDAHIVGEKFGPLNKSLIAIRAPFEAQTSPGFRLLRRPRTGSADSGPACEVERP